MELFGTCAQFRLDLCGPHFKAIIPSRNNTHYVGNLGSNDSAVNDSIDREMCRLITRATSKSILEMLLDRLGTVVY